jgi:phosphoribosylformylglycinamidine cyclo-ligase
MQGRAKKDKLITGERIEPGNLIIGLRSGGRTRYEKTLNSGIMCNGITLARRCLMNSDYMTRYPEITGTSKGYQGRFQVSDPIEDSDMTIGEVIASPTRIFAPVILRILREFGNGITGLVHNTQGGLTKSLKLGRNLKYVKNHLPDPDPIFPLIQAESGESWREMYRDFNMGVGFEVVAEREATDGIIQISEDLGVGARVIGQVADGPEWTQVIIESSLGTIKYEGARRET